MKPILKVLAVVTYLAGCYELFGLGIKLFNYPNDLAVFAGAIIMSLLFVGNFEVIQHFLNKGKNEESN